MNRAIAALLSIFLMLLLAFAARGADDGDAKKRPESGTTASDSAALFDKLDANHDGFITSDEVPQESRRLFDRLLRRGDKNADGKLSRDEFTSAMSEDRPAQGGLEQPPDAGSRTGPRGGMPGGIGGRAGAGAAGGPAGGPGPFMGVAVFRALDTNGDGKLDAKEIAVAADVLKKLANKDGEVTREELLKSLPPGMGPGGGGAGPLGAPGTAAGGQPGQAEMNPEAAFKRMMAMFDKNGDGKFQKDELPPRLADRFEELDTNKDGVLDESEVKTILPQLMRRLQNAGSQGAANAPAGAQRRRLLMQDNTKSEAQKDESK